MDGNSAGGSPLAREPQGSDRPRQRTIAAMRRIRIGAAALVVLGLQAGVVVVGLHFVPGVVLPKDRLDLLLLAAALLPAGMISFVVVVPLGLLGGLAVSDSDGGRLTAIVYGAILLVIVVAINTFVMLPYGAALEQMGVLSIEPPITWNDSDAFPFLAIGVLETAPWALPLAIVAYL